MLVVAGWPVHDATEFLAAWVHDPDAARAAAIDIAFDVYLHAIGYTGLVTAQISEHPPAGSRFARSLNWLLERRTPPGLIPPPPASADRGTVVNR